MSEINLSAVHVWKYVDRHYAAASDSVSRATVAMDTNRTVRRDTPTGRFSNRGHLQVVVSFSAVNTTVNSYCLGSCQEIKVVNTVIISRSSKDKKGCNKSCMSL